MPRPSAPRVACRVASAVRPVPGERCCGPGACCSLHVWEDAPLGSPALRASPGTGRENARFFDLVMNTSNRRSKTARGTLAVPAPSGLPTPASYGIDRTAAELSAAAAPRPNARQSRVHIAHKPRPPRLSGQGTAYFSQYLSSSGMSTTLTVDREARRGASEPVRGAARPAGPAAGVGGAAAAGRARGAYCPCSWRCP